MPKTTRGGNGMYNLGLGYTIQPTESRLSMDLLFGYEDLSEYRYIPDLARQHRIRENAFVYSASLIPQLEFWRNENSSFLLGCRIRGAEMHLNSRDYFDEHQTGEFGTLVSKKHMNIGQSISYSPQLSFQGNVISPDGSRGGQVRFFIAWDRLNYGLATRHIQFEGEENPLVYDTSMISFGMTMRFLNQRRYR